MTSSEGCRGGLAVRVRHATTSFSSSRTKRDQQRLVPVLVAFSKTNILRLDTIRSLALTEMQGCGVVVRDLIVYHGVVSGFELIPIHLLQRFSRFCQLIRGLLQGGVNYCVCCPIEISSNPIDSMLKHSPPELYKYGSTRIRLFRKNVVDVDCAKGP